MLFTTWFALIGVSLIGLAVGEIMEEVRAVRSQRKRMMIEKVAEALLVGHLQAGAALVPSRRQRLRNWSKTNQWTRVTRVLAPFCLVGCTSAMIILSTEEEDSEIMRTSDPFVTAFYVGIITGLSTGYGDYTPSTLQGRGLFIIFIPFAVTMMLFALDEVNEMVRVWRTVTTVEVVDIRAIMEIDSSGDGEIDMNEYVRHMLQSTGQVDTHIIKGFENQFHALDSTMDGTLALDDFPEGMGLQKTKAKFNGAVSTEIEVVPLPGFIPAATPAAAAGDATPAGEAVPGTAVITTTVADGRTAENGGNHVSNNHMRKGNSENKGAVASVVCVVGYLIIAAVFYVPVSGWSVSDSVYFAMCTITTVGYGDFNGGESTDTMIFTSIWAFVGVGIIGLAIGEILQVIDEFQQNAKTAMMDKVATDIAEAVSGGMGSVSTNPNVSPVRRFLKWTKTGLIGRILRINVPMAVIGFVGTGILYLTEEPDSKIMSSESPIISSFYCTGITALAIGYGDYHPSNALGRGLFIICMPMFIVAMLRVLDEINDTVRWLRTTTTVEVVDIRNILDMDDSGEGEVDVNEYIMYMLESTGTCSDWLR
jgi:hypothetical protein